MNHPDVSRHKCLIYDGHASEQLPVVVPLVLQSLAERDRCLYIGDPDMVTMMKGALHAKGLDVAQAVDTGSLVFSSERAPDDAVFDPKALIAMLVRMITDAMRDGYRGLCATGDMRWELGRDENFERLLEYEALLEQVFRDKPLRGICQYHKNTVPSSAIQHALLTHRSLYVGETLTTSNVFYVPPELLLQSTDRAQAVSTWMTGQLERIQKAEHARDIALGALRSSESSLRRLADDLAASNRDLEKRVHERTAALESANKTLESFSYSISHDLRAPVRGINGFAQALEDDFSEVLGPQGLDYVQRVKHASERMNALIEGMLALGQVSAAPVASVRVDLSALAAAVVQELRLRHPSRAVDVTIAPELTVSGDPVLLRAALENLLSNAFKFTAMRSPSRIEVAGGEVADGLRVFRVADNGAGFDMEYAAKLFGMFQRLHSQEQFEGTGVGLATVARIIQRHGGRIWAESVPNAGAAFFFSLPVAPTSRES